jgi:hypothetical protein
MGIHIQKEDATTKPSSAIDSLDPTLWTPVTHDFEGGKSYQETQKEAAEYAVTGAPRHIPWSRRKKELEQAARQKRRQLESFREEA